MCVYVRVYMRVRVHVAGACAYVCACSCACAWAHVVRAIRARVHLRENNVYLLILL